ncbi:MAG: aldolase/citrate lyase family protein [Clostridia bacterium]|nr:aldolase/citrate lyase family protein [Clostridia bacterium]
MIRSLLFLPGNTPNIIINGDALGADAVILDLEDAVAPDQKDAARFLVRNALDGLGFSGCCVVVRINATDTEFWRDDIAAVIPARPDYIMPAKVSSAAMVREISDAIAEAERGCGITEGSVKLMPLIESALGVENAYEIASAAQRVAALLLGGEDLTADLRCKRTKEGNEIEYARCRLVCAARAAGIDVFDTPFTDVHDDVGAEADAEYARALGFSGKAAISPRHVRAINGVFSPTRQEIEHATLVLEAIESAKALGRGAVSLNGKMIDKPIAERAKQTLEAARQLGISI